MSEKVLVTGAGGFIGSHLVELLVTEGFDVRAFVHYNSANHHYNLAKLPDDIRDSVDVVAGDVADPYAVDNAVKGCRMVFHLAALIGIPYSYVAPASYVNTNVVGTLNVLEACRRHDVARLMHTSTSETYGTAQYVPIDEKHPLVGQSPYSASKIGADKLAESYFLSFGLPVCIVRPFNTYGPRQSARAVIPTIICQALARDCVKLGSLTPVRDMTYAEDTARGFIAASRSDQVLGQAVNLGFGDGCSIGEIAGKVFELLGKRVDVRQDDSRVRPEKSEVMKLISNNNRAKELMDWSPRIDLETGLARTIDYIRANLDEYKPDIYNV